MQAEPEDALDQIMVQAWQAVAQSLRQTGNQIAYDLRRHHQEHSVRSRAARERLQSQRLRMQRWRASESQRLNKGFHDVLEASLPHPADGSRLADWDDARLLKTWVVAGQIDDPAYLADALEAKTILEEDWERRRADGRHAPVPPIGEAADALTRPAAIRYTDPEDPDFLSVRRCFEQDDVAIVSLEPVDPAQAGRFRREHDGKSFSVETADGSWNGMDRERLTQAVMTSPTNDPAARIAFLKANLPETAPADNTAAGTEIEAPREHTQSDHIDAAPVQAVQDAAAQKTDTPAARQQERPVTAGRSDESVGEAASTNHEAGVEPDWRYGESEPWGGPSAFGWYSPQEQAMLRQQQPSGSAPSPSSDPLAALAGLGQGASHTGRR
ncbi:MAG: hypothetical protein LKI34_08555 [Bifidobacterium tibiigranuli]|jgi:hypothetical protein|uniref:hypothetical protein n=1 Tax=Bifidobacterium tibiigranuli TaxID=2172043 RepID=UPI0026ECB39D|nr:hypothetical protein [Bifidobacterium tibiigranuli]MCI1674246.1 hypothetical protein [Bifidobacterium tibiigranuli]MCI1713474.1 hypothetical protein [Bifidobacterium tibiigranuli]